jgi:hypothetical protein
MTSYNDFYKYKNSHYNSCRIKSINTIAVGVGVNLENFCSDSSDPPLNVINLEAIPDNVTTPNLQQQQQQQPLSYDLSTYSSAPYTFSSKPSSQLYAPVFAQTVGYNPRLYLGLDNPIEFEKNLSNKWSLAIQCETANFNGAVLQNIGTPQVDTDATHKSYVDNAIKQPANENRDMNGYYLKNVAGLCLINNPSSATFNNNTNALSLVGNPLSSFGNWTYQPADSSTISTFEISGMPTGSTYQLILQAPSTTSTIAYCGGGINYVYTSWSTSITLGGGNFYRIEVTFVNPQYLLTFYNYN